MLNVLPAKRSSQCHPARWAYLQNNNWHVVSPSDAPIECGVARVRGYAWPSVSATLHPKPVRRKHRRNGRHSPGFFQRWYRR